MNIARAARAALTVAALVVTASAPGALNAYRTNVKLAHDQKTTDGKLLKAGPYDIDINFAGKGNVAEFVFLQHGIVIGRQPAEARGFATDRPDGGARNSDVKLHAGEQVEGKCCHTMNGIPVAFSWGAAGFGPEVPPKLNPGAAGRAIIAVDSLNSAAGFRTELLPAIPAK